MSIARPVLQRLRRFSRHSQAVAATEFALILPFMLVLYLGGVEVTQLLSIDRKTAQATRTIADLVAQKSKCDTPSSVPSSSDLKAFFDAADAVVSPYKSEQMAVKVSCIAIDKNGTAEVIWSRMKDGSNPGISSSFAAPAGLNDTSATTYWVLGEATYVHTPTIGYVLTGPFNLSEQVYMRSRI